MDEWTRDQVMARLRAAQSCAGDINAANQRYVLGGTGSVSVDSQNPDQRLPGFNSNGGGPPCCNAWESIHSTRESPTQVREQTIRF